MAKPEEEKQVIAGVSEVDAGQPRPPTANYRELVRSQVPISETIGKSGVIQSAANGGRIGLPSKADAVARMMPAPVANAVDIGTMIARGLRGPKTPAIASAAAAPAPAAAKQPTVQQAGSMLGLTPVPVDKMWNTKLNQATPSATAGNVRSRPTVPGAPKPQAAPVAAPIQAAAAPAADDSVIIDRGLARPGSTMAMIDHETGDILTAAGGTDTYRQFEGQYMTQGQQDEITANRLNVGDPMSVGQAGSISKQAALLNDRAMAEAGQTQRTDKTVAGGIAQQKISTGGAIQSANIAHGESNKLKALEVKAIAALDAALQSGDGAAIAMAQQQLAAIRGGSAKGSEYAPVTVYDESGQPTRQLLYNKANATDVVDPSNPGVKPTSRTEYDALKPGSQYVGPDGKRYIKGQ